MKKIFTLLTIIIAFVFYTKAQAPQGLNYQAVAYNAGGTAVANQAVRVRLSILDGAATGSLLYQEVQNPTTDNTGLFSIVIGNGTIVSGTFADINWGSGSKWLKTEIDITGGTNYLVMGTSQFMSVPYALYANKAGYADKTSFSSGSFTIPDGFDNATTVYIPNSVAYIVPSGKNLYIPSAMWGISIDGDTLGTGSSGFGADARTFLGASAGSVVWARYVGITAFLVDKKVEWKTLNIANAPFVIPTGKQFVVVNCTMSVSNGIIPGASNCSATVNGNLSRAITNTILAPGSVISTSGCTSAMAAKFILNGYFMDR